MKEPQLILASSSVYRQAQLKQIHLAYKAISPEVDERKTQALESDPRTLAERLASLKSHAVKKNFAGNYILGCDQVCAMGEQIFNKPETQAQALIQLHKLQGKTHSLYTAYSLIAPDGEELIECIEAKMSMRPLTQDQIESYLKLDRPFDCAGSYKIEKAGIGLFNMIDVSDFSSIIGLPIMSLISSLEKLAAPIKYLKE